MSVRDKVLEIKGRKYGGSSTKDCKLYHELPFDDLKGFRRHRGGTKERIERIARLGCVKDKTVLDLGCSVGGLSFGMAQKGADLVLGVDYDTESINVAKEVQNLKGFPNITFDNSEITIEFIKKLPRFNVVIWMSQWMWTVKQHGMDYAKDLLFEVSKKADVMIFESAADDGMARIKGASQDDIAQWLAENTCYRRFKRTPTTRGWMNRAIFECSRPWDRIESTRKAASSIVERISRDKVKKTYRTYPKDCVWMKEREAKALRLLEKYDGFPKLLEEGDDYIIMNYLGARIKFGFKGYKEQAYSLLERVKDVGLLHRDINRKNFLVLNGKLSLIDFGWCVFNGEDVSKARTHKNLRVETDDEMIKEIFG